MPARLVPLNPGAAPTIAVQRPVVLVGRHPECDVRIDLPKISRRHCCVALAYDRVMIRDLGSRNGLWVNGLAVEESRLEHGDEVAIGPLLYRVENPEALPSPPARSSLAAPESAHASLPVPKTDEARPPSLPFLPPSSTDPDGDLIPIEL